MSDLVPMGRLLDEAVETRRVVDYQCDCALCDEERARFAEWQAARRFADEQDFWINGTTVTR